VTTPPISMKVSATMMARPVHIMVTGGEIDDWPVGVAPRLSRSVTQ
jgi:hypothetical protein